VNRGLLDLVETESQLAGALAREVGHIAGDHGLRELYEKVKQAAAADDKTMGQSVDRLGGPLATMRLLRYTRTDEVEADRLGFYNMIRAGWNPRGLLNLMERISRLAGDTGSPPDPRADHPFAAERCAAFREAMKRVRDADSLTENSLSFRVMKIGLKLRGVKL